MGPSSLDNMTAMVDDDSNYSARSPRGGKVLNASRYYPLTVDSIAHLGSIL